MKNTRRPNRGGSGGRNNKPQGNNSRPQKTKIQGGGRRSGSTQFNPLLIICAAIAAIAGVVVATNAINPTAIPSALNALVPGIVKTGPNGKLPPSELCNPSNPKRTVYALSKRGAIQFDISISPGDKNKTDSNVIVDNSKVGPQAIASANMAAVMSGLILGEDVSSCSFTVEPQAVGKIEDNQGVDGPSAGSLFTSAFLSLLRQQELKKDVTMTGTINPDGTVGFIGGLNKEVDPKSGQVEVPGKLKAAENHRADKKIDKMNVLIPPQKDTEVSKTDIELDYVDVTPVATIYEAYEKLTDNPLPKYVSTNLPIALDPNVSSELKSSIQSLETQYANSVQSIRAIDIKDIGLNNSFKTIAAMRNRLYQQHDGYLAQGEKSYSAAYGRMLEANSLASISKNFKELVVSLESNINNADAFVANIYENVLRQKTQLKEKLENKVKANLPLSFFIENYSGYAIADALLQESIKLKEPLSASNALQWITYKVFLPTFAEQYIEFANTAIKLGNAELRDQPYNPDENQLKQKLFAISQTINRAASANFKYSQTLSRPKDLDFVIANATQQLSEKIAGELLQESQNHSVSIAKVYQLIGYATSSFLRSSMLVHKYYSLVDKDFEVDFLGSVTQLSATKETALQLLLASADEDAKNLVIFLKDKNLGYGIPTFNYLVSQNTISSGKTIADDVSRLQGLWYASLEARLTLMINGVKPTVN